MASKYYTDADGFYIGSFWDDTPAPDGAIECGEGFSGCRLVGNDWVPCTEAEWLAHFAPPLTLEEWRATATADAWQIIAVLGPERWKVIVEWAAGQNFVTQTLIEKAVNIPRGSEMVQVLAWILGLSDTEVDEIFRQAAELRA